MTSARLLDERIPVDLHIPKPHKEISLRPEILDRYTGATSFRRPIS